LLLSIVALHSLFRGKLISGHDATCYPPRIVEFAKVMLDGQIPAVWAPDLSAGHGQPLFEFSPPLLYLAAMPFYATGFNITDSIQFGLAFLFLLGAAAFYRVGRMLTDSRAAALGAAAAWLFAPYLALDLNVRAAFAEAAAVAVLPIVLLGFLRVLERPTLPRIALGAVAVSLLLQAHSAISLLSLPALVLIVLLVTGTTWREDAQLSVGQRIAPIAAGAAAMLLGFGLSAYVWMPSVFEKNLVHVERLKEGLLNWSRHFALPAQLIWSAWGFGYSGPGAHKGLSLAVGPLHLALAVAGFVFAIRSKRKHAKGYAIAFALAALIGCWLSTDGALVIWQHVEMLQYLQFPWRALVLPGLFLPLLAVFLFERIGTRWTLVAGLALVLFNLPHTEPKDYLTFDDEYYAPTSIAAQGINTLTREEFEPRWVGSSRPAYDPRGLAGVGSAIETEEVSHTSWRQVYSVRTAEAVAVQSTTFFYPGWQVYVDGRKVPVAPVADRGTMQFALPAGQHQVVLELKRTGIRAVALGITEASLLALAALFILRWPVSRIRKFRRPPAEIQVAAMK